MADDELVNSTGFLSKSFDVSTNIVNGEVYTHTHTVTIFFFTASGTIGNI
jgi:hypothetical protein